MSKNINSVTNANDLQFKSYLQKSAINSEVLDQYFLNLYKKKDNVLFINRLNVVKKYVPEFLMQTHNSLWAAAILSPEIEVNCLLSLGFIPQKESKLVEYIFFRKVLYSKEWETSDDNINNICVLVKDHTSKKVVIKQLENFLNSRVKNIGYVENSEIDLVEKFYHIYQDTDKQFNLRWTIFKKQINAIEKMQGDITSTYAFEELIMPNIEKLIKYDDSFIDKLKTLKTKDHSFMEIVEKRLLYKKLDIMETTNSLELPLLNKLKI